MNHSFCTSVIAASQPCRSSLFCRSQYLQTVNWRAMELSARRMLTCHTSCKENKIWCRHESVLSALSNSNTAGWKQHELPAGTESCSFCITMKQVVAVRSSSRAKKKTSPWKQTESYRHGSRNYTGRKQTNTGKGEGDGKAARLPTLLSCILHPFPRSSALGRYNSLMQRTN